jgi:hypothetical protein
MIKKEHQEFAHVIPFLEAGASRNFPFERGHQNTMLLHSITRTSWLTEDVSHGILAPLPTGRNFGDTEATHLA